MHLTNVTPWVELRNECFQTTTRELLPAVGTGLGIGFPA